MDVDSNFDGYIIECNATLLLRKEKEPGELRLNCHPTSTLFQTSHNFYLKSELFPELINKMEDFRAGGNVNFFLDIKELTFIVSDRNGKTFEPAQKGSRSFILTQSLFQTIVRVTYFDMGSPETYKLTRDQWQERILAPLGFPNKFIIELPYNFKKVIIRRVDAPEFVELKKRYNKAVEIIIPAITEFQRTRDTIKAIAMVRQITDLFHRFPNRKRKNFYQNTGNYLLTETETCSINLTSDLMKDIFSLFDNLFSISSKGVHRTTRGNGSIMGYYPRLEDIDMLLANIAFLLSYIGKKFERLER